jgi:hypothetical protein
MAGRSSSAIWFLGLALAGAASGLGDDDLEDAGERDSPQSCDLGGIGLA